MKKTTTTKTRTRYAVISPDGFTIEAKASYPTQWKAWQAFINWRERYEIQGYYSSVKHGRIDLEILHNFCQFKKI